MKSRMVLLIILLLGLLASCQKAIPALELEPCSIAGTRAQCGSLTVPENRESGTGRTIDLNLAVIRAEESQKAEGAVFLLSGGPGDAATQDTSNIQGLLPYLGDRDLVLVDQRGTGKSNEVFPPDSPDWSGLSVSEVEKAYSAWIAEVLPTLDADPRYYTTSVAMDDLDDVRQVLGYEKIDLIGISYGATAAQYYLRQHEPHVRSVVLIVGSVGDVPIWERQAANAQRALESLFTRCESDPACQEAYPNVRSEFASLQERLNEGEIMVEWEGGMANLTAEVFAAMVEELTRDTADAARLPDLIHRAYAQDDWRGFVRAGYGDWKGSIMSYSIQCNEKWAGFSPEETARQGQGSYLLAWNLFRARKYSLLCKYLPPGIVPKDDGHQPVSQLPVLLFNGELDPVDPPENVAASREIWPNSLALTLRGQGHSLSDRTAYRCEMNIIEEFLKEGSTKQLSTSCLETLQPPPFVIMP